MSTYRRIYNTDGKEVFFKRQNKMFVVDVAAVASVLMNIAEKKIQYSAAEVKRAEMVCAGEVN
jgi:hypothetical protein